ncbi:MAG: NAD(P)H-dependent oxidoreductase subunit E [Thiobacillaceae bacterium]|nr:NAD(P)H-dependent oxidoreductase subunit E [Thiobacillaceae bacterium]MCX7673664.1 NAD(P)H-dependent oxidoreductase subunit E [Thiobacillaceae bacterium]MDW8323900.1 NAD(P)H-dependent oxidoreductase subunit E [Burkholderiales bacterium]
MSTPPLTPELEAVLDRHGRDPTRLVQILREAQELAGWLPPPLITALARALRLPRARVEGTAAFYSFLYLRPAGRYRVLFSDNVTDRMQGSEALLDQLCERLWAEKGRVTEDGLVYIDTTSCTGLCDQGPGLLVNGWAIPRASRERLDLIAGLILEQRPLAEWPAELFHIDHPIHRRDLLLAEPPTAGEALAAVLAHDADGSGLLAQVERAGLRGRGGAGFPTARKWAACRQAPGAVHYVVCNADEGEPGTFKDRVLLAEYADLVLEGMTLCAYVLGAGRSPTQGLIYLRGEYRFLLEHLQSALARRRAAGLLGRAICGRAGFDFDIELHLGAGAYVCGEESALLESLEGKRGVPRNRPPYPVTHGYLGQPTVVNNVETFCAAAVIARHGAEAYRARGTPDSPGSKLLSVAGDCARPGVYEYPFGVTVREVLADCGAQDAQAVQVGGPSGTLVGPHEFDRRIAFEDLATAGAFTVFGPQRDLFEVVRNYVHFFAHESCGFCTPCRVGTAILRGVMDKIHAGRGARHDLEQLEQVERAMRLASHCGLGQTACNPLRDLRTRFRPTLERRLASLDFAPAFDLDAALARARAFTGRDDARAHLHTDTLAS